MNFVELTRRFYNVEHGRKVMEGTFGKQAHDPVALANLQVQMKKVASADPALMKIALKLAGEGDVLEMYERLGGTFKKEAIGAPMFSPPALSPKPVTSAPMAGQLPKPVSGVNQAKVPQVPNPTAGASEASQQKIKVQLNSPQGEQGTSVSVG